jgi:hypothetical protein
MGRRSFKIGFSIPKKKWPLFGRATKNKKLISVYQRTSYSANLSDNPPKKKRSYSTPASE